MKPDPTPEQHQEAEQKARAVLTAIGYTIDEKDAAERNQWKREVNLRATDGDKMLHVRAFSYDIGARMSFGVSYPRDARGQLSTHGIEYPSITCALTKTAEKITAEVKRRLLPAYEANLEKVRASNARSNAYQNAKTENARKIKGAELDDHERKSGAFRFYLDGTATGGGAIYGDCQAYDDSATINLHNLPVPLAAKILAFVRKEAKP